MVSPDNLPQQPDRPQPPGPHQQGAPDAGAPGAQQGAQGPTGPHPGQFGRQGHPGQPGPQGHPGQQGEHAAHGGPSAPGAPGQYGPAGGPSGPGAPGQYGPPPGAPGYGGPPGGPPYGGPPQQGGARRRSGGGALWWVLGAAAVVLVLVVAGGGAVVYMSMSGPPGPPPGADSGSVEPGDIEGVRTFDNLDPTHTEEPVEYPVHPPVGGPHSPIWLDCGVYTQPVPDENAVHSLEHGAVWITYNSGSVSATDLATLEGLYRDGDYLVVSPMDDLPGRIVASAWGKQLVLDSADDPRLTEFLNTYVQGPQTLEPGAPCSGGTGITGEPV
ncbi:DUF3105 domain-containing protein [Streptomonospora sp. S1-112]|uniref:DUF3105 domain-containing protein n=1 Tax=Streptomonospora mangrovi TaxID=2883123 RepID=A0A9X3NSV3_9ACTN|nr:DUF3105 domain-containing protein [Streptomonospora mangrovi]MDA0563541.1 DUF3105 domain-containing protein [Streptomonospora mangrovi]